VKRPSTNFWEGTDDKGRTIRAYLHDDAMLGKVITIRALTEWKREHESFSWRMRAVANVNETRLRYGRRRLPLPRLGGRTWTAVATFTLAELGQAASIPTSMRLGFRDVAPRYLLPSKAVQMLAVFIDAALEGTPVAELQERAALAARGGG